jgi:hypothetical protein
MVRPQVADGGDGPQIWRVAANILNKQPRTAVVLQLGGWAGGEQPTTVKLLICYETHTRASDQDGFFGKTSFAPKNGHEIWHLEC